MKILDRLPITERPALITVQGEAVAVYRNQILIWVSIGDVLRPFPAILDTGHSHNFSISESQLHRWSGVALKKIGELEIDRERVSQFAAEVSIHRNIKGTMARGIFPLEMPQGISVFPEGGSAAPRLPLLGLRTIISNRLKLIIDGERRRVTLRTRWF